MREYGSTHIRISVAEKRDLELLKNEMGLKSTGAVIGRILAVFKRLQRIADERGLSVADLLDLLEEDSFWQRTAVRQLNRWYSVLGIDGAEKAFMLSAAKILGNGRNVNELRDLLDQLEVYIKKDTAEKSDSGGVAVAQQ